MTTKTKAIVLHTVKFGDSKLIIDFYTEAMGRLSFVVRISKSAKAKMKRQYFQPLAILNIEFDYRAKASLQQLKDAYVAVPYADIPVSPYKITIALFLSEFLTYSTRNEQANAPLFLFLQQSMEWLDTSTANFSNFHIVFMVKLTIFLGIYPNLSDDAEESVFDLQEGKFVPHVPLHGDHISGTDTYRLKALARLNYQTMHLYTMSHQERNMCVEMILRYYRLHLPAFPEMKTLSVLKELFA